jgi:hypothetical protein
MNDQRSPIPFYARRAYRLLSGSFGLFLIGVGVYVLISVSPLTSLRLLAAAALIVFGANMVASAYSGKESWLSKIGPLP